LVFVTRKEGDWCLSAEWKVVNRVKLYFHDIT
jgi:hypothetical protein